MRAEENGSIAPRLRGTPTAILFYIALTFVLTWPLSVAPASRVLWTGPDTELFMWTLAWDAHAFIAQPFSIFDANIFHPLRRTLAYSENLIGSALVAAPVLWLTGNVVLAMNAAGLLSVVLCGAGTYVLARRVGIGAAGAMLAGIIFAFSPPRFFRLGQLHLTAMQWMPFCLAFLHGYLDGGRRRDLRLAAACFSLQALSSGHGAVFLTIAAGALVAWRLALGVPVAFARRVRDPGVSELATCHILRAAVMMWTPPRRRVERTDQPSAHCSAGSAVGWMTSTQACAPSWRSNTPSAARRLKARTAAPSAPALRKMPRCSMPAGSRSHASFQALKHCSSRPAGMRACNPLS